MKKSGKASKPKMPPASAPSMPPMQMGGKLKMDKKAPKMQAGGKMKGKKGC